MAGVQRLSQVVIEAGAEQAGAVIFFARQQEQLIGLAGAVSCGQKKRFGHLGSWVAFFVQHFSIIRQKDKIRIAAALNAVEDIGRQGDDSQDHSALTLFPQQTRLSAGQIDLEQSAAPGRPAARHRHSRRIHY